MSEFTETIWHVHEITQRHVKWSCMPWMTFDEWQSDTFRRQFFTDCAPKDAKPGSSVVVNTEIVETDAEKRMHHVLVIGYALPAK